MNEKYIHIIVHPKAKQEKIEEKENGYLEVYCREPAERGLANAFVKKKVAEHLKIPEKRISIISGHRKGKKILKIYQPNKDSSL